jgi:hypothetical protein
VNVSKKTANPNTMAVCLKIVCVARLLPVLLLLALTATVQAQFSYTTNTDGSLNVYQYTGSGGAVIIPATTNGLPVTSIGNMAFHFCLSLTSVTIPDSVTIIEYSAFNSCSGLASVTIGNSLTNIEDEAFLGCASLTGVYFHGNAPNSAPHVFVVDNNATVYYLPGTTNWGTTFGGRPTALWNPQAQTSDASFGVRTNQFGFNITGTTNIPIVIEACANLASPVWVPLQSCTLTNGSVYFCDPQWTNYPSRFYRFRSP